MALTKLTQNLIDGTLVTSVNSLTGAVTLETGTDWINTIQTSNFTAVAGKGYFVNTTSGEITVTLPAGVVGNEVIIQDYAGTFATNKVIFASNGSEKIQGSTDNFQNTTNNSTITLVYQDTTKGWTSDSISILQVPLVVDYLVAAGGGGGASGYGGVGGGGGGAGGLRSSYGNTAGTPAWVNETRLTTTVATNYSVTVGAGGTGSSYTGSSGTNGSNSVFHTITSVGGGGSQSYGGSSSSNGGSGGGGTYITVSPGSANTSPVSGHGGGSGTASGNAYGGGGGGGTGGAGGNGTSSTGGTGGDGLEVNIIGGTGNYYAGGGGGGASAGSGGAGGSGVGGNGGSNSAGVAATVNTGSGGGGGAGGITTSVGAGGSDGIVILRYPSSYTISGLSGNTTTVGADKVTTFTTAGTGNIQFN